MGRKVRHFEVVDQHTNKILVVVAIACLSTNDGLTILDELYRGHGKYFQYNFTKESELA